MASPAHVADQRVVAEARAALADHDLVVADRATLVDDLLHVPGRLKLALLDVHGLSGARHALDEVRLTHEEGRRLQHVDHIGDLVDGGVLVDVGEHRKAELALDLGENAQALRDAGAAIGRLPTYDWPCRSSP